MDIKKTIQYRKRALRFIEWIDIYLAELRTAEKSLDLEAVHRSAFVLLALLQSLSESVRVSQKRFDLSVDEFDALVKNDELLRYINLARNSEVHADIVKLKKEGFSGEFEVIDFDRLKLEAGGTDDTHAQEVIMRALGAASLEEVPKGFEKGEYSLDHELLARSGIKLSNVIEHFMFIDFEINNRKKREKILAPTKHLDQQLVPIVSECIAVARNFFNLQLIALENEMRRRPDIVTVGLPEKE